MRFKTKIISVLILIFLSASNFHAIGIASTKQLSKNDIIQMFIKANNINYDIRQDHTMTAMSGKKIIKVNKASYVYCKSTDCWKISEGLEDKKKVTITYVNYIHDMNKVEEYTVEEGGTSKISGSDIAEEKGWFDSLNRFFDDKTLKLVKLIVSGCSISQKKNEIVVSSDKLPASIVKNVVSKSAGWKSYKVDNIGVKFVIKNKKITQSIFTYYVRNSKGKAETIVLSTECNYGKHYLKPFNSSK